MVPDDGEPRRPDAPVQRPREDDDAFAATIAPAPITPVPPVELPRGSADRKSTSPRGPAVSLEPDASPAAFGATMAAPLSKIEGIGDAPELPPLPIVPEEHYKAGDEIARGGMGRIVAAEDQRLGRPVALKVLLEPAGDSLGRFQREALITARLQHPGIVPVYEAGRWPSGEPFFAMKLVSGKPLDQVIAKTRTLEDRLALLPRIAAATDAIAYAHSQRVVHRDLKPGNVLIGDFGETVVIDWGLAKDLDATDSPESVRAAHAHATKKPLHPTSTAASTLTVAGAVMGTPAYMAPEQARGEPVDQRADVFALGAMLYHLLAGVPPYNARTATDVIAAAALHKVIPLVERERAAPRDLVAIVERAMAAQPKDRYADAGALADELRRFLTGQLVSAHRYTAFQRLARFVRKNRAAVSIGTIAILGFAISGTLAVRQIMAERDKAEFERSLATTRRDAAEGLIDSMLLDMRLRLVQIGRLDLLAALGNQIRDYYRTLEAIPGGMPQSDFARMASAAELVGLAERDSGNPDGALAIWGEVREKTAALVGKDTSPTTRGARMMVARLDFQIGTVSQARGKMAHAIDIYRKAKDEFAALIVEAPRDRQILLYSAENHDRLGDILRNEGKLDTAMEEYTEAKSERTVAKSTASDDPAGVVRPVDAVLALSTSHLKVGTVYQARGDTATALSEYRAALRLRETLLETQPDNIDVQERVIDVQETIADLQRQTGDGPSAVTAYEQSVPILESMLERDPDNTTWQRHHANILAELGFSLLDIGEFKRGLDVLKRAVERQSELVAKDQKNTSWRVDLSRSHTRLGDGQTHLGLLDDAIASYTRGLELRQALVVLAPKNVAYRRSLAWSHAKLAGSYARKKELPRALEEHEKALELRARLVSESPGQSGYRNELASTEVALGRLLGARDARRGTELVTNGLARARSLVQSDPINNEWKDTLVQGLIARADLAKQANDRTAARAALVEALEVAHGAIERSRSNAHWPGLLAEVHAALAELATDRAAAAAEWRAVRETLEPLAKANKLSATRKPLLDRAIASR